MSGLTTCLLEWTYLFFDQSFFSHSVNCSDRVSVKIDHGSVNRPPIVVTRFSFSYVTFVLEVGVPMIRWNFSLMRLETTGVQSNHLFWIMLSKSSAMFETLITHRHMVEIHHCIFPLGFQTCSQYVFSCLLKPILQDLETFPLLVLRSGSNDQWNT